MHAALKSKKKQKQEMQAQYAAAQGLAPASSSGGGGGGGGYLSARSDADIKRKDSGENSYAPPSQPAYTPSHILPPLVPPSDPLEKMSSEEALRRHELKKKARQQAAYVSLHPSSILSPCLKPCSSLSFLTCSVLCCVVLFVLGSALANQSKRSL